MSRRSTLPGSRLRVGFLCYGLDRPLTGTTRVAEQLGEALYASGECEVTFLTTYRRGVFRAPPYETWYLPGCRLLPALMALGGPLISAAAQRLGLDVVHDPVGVSPFTIGRRYGRYGRVLAIHDAIAFRYPQGYPWLNNFLHRHYVPATLSNVDAVVTDSARGREDVLDLLRVPPSKVHSVPLGVDRRFRPLPADESRTVAERYGLARPYVLCVGAQQARKGVARVVEAMTVIWRSFPQHQLAIVGPSQWRFGDVSDAIARAPRPESIHMLGYVPNEDLAALYSAADVFAFPSLYEGFGLPVLEAMACGTPVVCSRATSLPEIAEGAALLIDPLNSAALASAIERVLRDEALAHDLGERGAERARCFTWERTAERTLAIYRRVQRG